MRRDIVLSINVKNTMYSSIQIYVEYFIGFAISVLIARSLGPEDFGNYGFFVKLCGVAMILTNSGINTGVVKFIAEARNASDDVAKINFIASYLQRLQLIKTIVFSGLMVTALALFPKLFIKVEDVWLALLLLVGSIFFKSGYMYRINVLRGSERFDLMAFTVLIVCPINLVAALLAYYLQLGLDSYIYLFFAISFLYWLAAGLFIPKIWRKEASFDADYSDIKERINHHVKLMSISAIIGGIGVGQVEVLLLQPLVGSEAVSYFTIAATIAGAVMLLVPGVYSSILLPVIARTLFVSKKNTAKKIQNSMRHLFILSMLVGIPNMLYARDIVVILYGQEYVQAAWILSVLVLAKSFGICLEPLSAYLLSADKQVFLLKISITFFIVTWSLSYFAISEFGLKGAVAAAIAILIIKILVITVTTKKSIELRLNLFGYLRVLFAAGISGMISFIAVDDHVGILRIILGFGTFSISYVFLLLTLGTLSHSEYKAIKHNCQKLGRLPCMIISLLIRPYIK